MERIAWINVGMTPTRVTFTGIQKAIFEANRAPPPSKKVAWQKVYKMSAQFQIQEAQTVQRTCTDFEKLMKDSMVRLASDEELSDPPPQQARLFSTTCETN